MRKPIPILPLLALLVLSLLLSPSFALADEPEVSDIGDRWLQENGGAGASDTSSYWPDTWLLDKAFGQDQSSTMQVILGKIAEAYDGQERGTSGADRCPNAAKVKLDLYAADSARMFARPAFAKFLFKAGIDIFGLPKKAGSSALNAAQSRIRDQFTDYLKDKAKGLPEETFKQIEKLLAEPGAPEVFSRNGSWTSGAASDCDISIRVVWDKTLQTSGSGERKQFYQTYRFFIVARCQCECDEATGVERRDPDKVKSLVSGGTGRVVVNVGARQISLRPGRPSVWAEFNCCGETRTRKLGRPPSRTSDTGGSRTVEPAEPPPPPTEVERAAQQAERADPKSAATQQAIENFRNQISQAKSVEELTEVYERMDGARRGFERQAELSPPDSPSGKAAKEAAEAIDELLQNELQKKYEELEPSEGGTGFARPGGDSWLAALNTELLYCPIDRTWLEPLRDEYAIAVQVPERCVGTWYYFEHGTIEQPPHISITYPPESGPPDSGQPGEPEVPVCTGPPQQPVPDTVETPTPSETSTPSETPTPTEKTPPTTTTEVPEEPDVPDETDEPDLGLVKATTEVVELALSTLETGEAIAGAAVKLLAPAPDLPTGASGETALSLADNYREDVPATNVDDAGTVKLSLTASENTGSTQTLALVEPELELVESESRPADANAQERQDSSISDGPNEAARTQLVAVQSTPSRQMIVAGNRPMTSLPASLLPASSQICVNRGFRVGDTPVFVVKVPEPEVEAFTDLIKTSEVISFFEPDPCKEKEVNDPHFAGKGLWGQDFDNQWAIKRVNIDDGKQTMQQAEDGRPVTVAVIDTGIDWYHPDLPHTKLWRNPAEVPDNNIDDDRNGYVDDVIGWNFVRPSRSPWDYDGHGTFVAGVIAAEQGNEIGIVGINPDARIMVLKALDAFGRGHASMVAEAIAYAADNGADIINLSLGGRSLTALEKLAVDHARSTGAIVVAAAGNDGKDVSDYGPAGLDGVVTVAATDRRNKRAGFSNWGAAVDIAAPGVDVLSLRARRTDLLSFIPGVKYRKGEGIVGEDRAYFRASGTSFATPIVAGTLSLLMSRRPELSAEQAVRMVLQSARDIETPGVDNYTGYGLLDAEAALKANSDYFLESRIHAVRVVGGSTPALRVIATSEADQFDNAVLMLGQGDAPDKWLKVNKTFSSQVKQAPLVDLPAKFFAGSQTWTIRLITRHKNGSEREARFKVTLG